MVLGPRGIAPSPFRYVRHFRDHGPRLLPLFSGDQGKFSAHKMGFKQPTMDSVSSSIKLHLYGTMGITRSQAALAPRRERSQTRTPTTA